MEHQTHPSNGGKVLVVYASQYGTTGDIARTVADVLKAEGHDTETRPIGDVGDLDGYDAVVIGSAIQYDRWMPEAVSFVRNHQDRLSTLPVAFFFTCLTLSLDTPKAHRQAQVYADRLAALFPRVSPMSIGRFAGVLNYRKLPVLARLAAGIAFAFLGVKEGDHRNWPAIKAWAKDIGAGFPCQSA